MYFVEKETTFQLKKLINKKNHLIWQSFQQKMAYFSFFALQNWTPNSKVAELKLKVKNLKT